MGCIYQPEGSENRCRSCRYWFERCCHALALMEPTEQRSHCRHFVNERTTPTPLLETASW